VTNRADENIANRKGARERGAGENSARPRIACRKVTLIFWASWLVPQILYFSVSIFYHRYYLAMMAPAIAALVGIGFVTLWEAWQAGGWQKWSIAVVIVLCALAQIGLLLPYPVWLWRLMPVIVGLSLFALVMLVLAWRKVRQHWAVAGFGLGFAALLVAPLVWTAIPVLTCTNMSLPLPSAGPQIPACRPFAIKPWLDPDLVAYLEQHRDGAEFLAATYDMGVALLGIMGSDAPFMALGGYRGTDPVLTVDEFADYVAGGRVRFFISMFEEPEYPQQQPIFDWVRAHCPEAEIESPGVYVWGPCIF
jgi:4-amino-4-deoxy-L-arabinose transferase-like glycosyltransferase